MQTIIKKSGQAMGNYTDVKENKLRVVKDEDTPDTKNFLTGDTPLKESVPLSELPSQTSPHMQQYIKAPRYDFF